MSSDHKAALAQGRLEGRVVRDYLEALRENKPKHGPKRTPTSITARLDAIETVLTDADADPVTELHLIQERRDSPSNATPCNKAPTSPHSRTPSSKSPTATANAKASATRSWRDIGIPGGRPRQGRRPSESGRD